MIPEQIPGVIPASASNIATVAPMSTNVAPPIAANVPTTAFDSGGNLDSTKEFLSNINYFELAFYAVAVTCLLLGIQYYRSELKKEKE
jgi:hypothetical protein